MDAIRRCSVPRVALLLWAHLALLPPGAWTLCRAQGHVAFEPTATACADIPEGTDAAACAAQSCAPCVDVPLLTGVAIHRAQPQLDAPAALAVVAGGSGAAVEMVIAPHAWALAGHPSDLLPHIPRTPILRC